MVNERKRRQTDNEDGEAVGSKRACENSGYADGAIVRVKLVNFVTYEALEFSPGPNLNMIIGPNGTGKSTIVCAIALGLGGSPSLLGRQKEVKDFIKESKDHASIEIELFSSKRSNIVIKREFKRANNKNVWRINGVESSLEAVKKKVNKLDIQVDNLCQFLPQDKVSEFAQMDAQKLLQETMRAADPIDLPTQFQQLCELRAKEKTNINSIDALRTELETLTQKNQALEPDLALFREREKILKLIQKLERTIPLTKFFHASEISNELKKRAAHAVEQMKKLEALQLPDLDALQKLKQELDVKENEFKHTRKDYSDKTKALQNTTEKLKDLDTRIEELRPSVKRETAKMKTLETRIGKFITEIGKLQSDKESLKLELIKKGLMNEHGELLESGGGESSDLTQIMRKLDEIGIKIREKVHEGEDVSRNYNNLSTQAVSIRRDIDDIVRQIAALGDPKAQKKAALRNYESMVMQASEYVKNNKDKFKMEVFGPIILEVDITDTKYAQYVESFISRGHQTFFLCQCKEDYLTLREIEKSHKWRLSSAVLDEGKDRISYWRPSMTKEQLRNYGFDGLAIDFLEGPEKVLCFLCQFANLHRKPLAVKEIDVNRIDPRVANEFIVGNTIYNIRSAYGATSTSARLLNQPRYLKTAVDTTLRDDLERQVADKQRQLKEIEVTVNEAQAEHRKKQDELKLLKDEKSALMERKQDILRDKRNYEHKLGEISTREVQLESLQSEISGFPAKIAKIKSDIQKLCKDRVKLCRQFLEQQQTAVNSHMERVTSALRVMHLTAAVQLKTKEIDNNSEQLREAKEIVNQAVESHKQKKAECEELKKRAHAIAKLMTQEEKDFARESKTRPIEELEDELAENIARADAATGFDPNIMKEYKAREQEITRLTADLVIKESEFADRAETIKTLKDSWYNKLTELIERINRGFSNAFERIGCSGEVQLHEEDDYDKWGINILVKFRDTERLQQLTAQRQSGGERSVSTIMYLMALQELSKSPFRVVDEINQGMDPRNERLVHSQLVEIACQPNTSQYFLITPKLLPDLEYHENMRILTIYSGDWTPKKIPYPTGLKSRSAKYTSAAN